MREGIRAVAGEIREEFLVVPTVVGMSVEAEEGAGAQGTAVRLVLCAVVETR